MAIATPIQKQTAFSRLGNLAFYDGWSPDYIYFKTLYNAGDYYIVNNGPSSWDPVQASTIAQKAINDALGHKYLKNNSQEDSAKYFEDQFVNKIIPFLEKAYMQEKQNEALWIKLKYRELKQLFNDDTKNLQPIEQLYDLINNVDKGFNYEHYTTLINLLLSGIEETQAIINQEEERIKEMRNIITKLIKSRMSQTEGVTRHSSKTFDEKILSQISSARKLKEKFEIEYVRTGTLSRTETIMNNGGTAKNKYAVFGGKQFSKLKPTIDNVIKLWSETVIKDIMQNPSVLSQIINNIKTNIPQIITKKTKSMESQIKQIIILAILEYGSQHLTDLLNTKLNAAMIEEVKQDLLTNTQLFDTAHDLQLYIKGLPEDEIATTIKEPELLKNTEAFAEQYKNSAKGLYNLVDNTISLMNKAQQKQSTLYKVLNNSSSTSGRNYEQTRQIIDLIHAVEKIQEQLNEMVEEYKKKNSDIVKKVHLPQNKSAGITISIVNGVPKVEENELLEAIKGTEAFSYMGYKSFTAEPIMAMINKLKSKASINLRRDIIQSISSGLYNTNPDEITSQLRQELQKIDITVEGFDIMQTLTAMQFRTTGNRLSGISPNGGVISISFAYENLMQSIRANINSGKILTEKADKIERHYTAAQNNFYTTMYNEINSGIKRVARRNTKDSRAKLIHTILQNTDKETKQIQNAMERLTKWGEQYSDILNESLKITDEKAQNAKRKQYIENLLDNSVYISTVVVNSDNYMNNIGFLGSSLGNNLNTQLTKISSIFRDAGAPISKEELQWIKFAILNCFEGSVLGTSNKNVIENYLGSLIAFALFNEGGVETSIIANTFEKYYKNAKSKEYHSAKMLTLYKANGIYIPSSVILKRTLDTLKQEVLPAIQTKIPKTMKRGAGITIINDVDESLIPNRPIHNHLHSQDKRAWMTVGTAAQNKVKIQILFLAGLLDIIKSINKTLGGLEFPS